MFSKEKLSSVVHHQGIGMGMSMANVLGSFGKRLGYLPPGQCQISWFLCALRKCNLVC